MTDPVDPAGGLVRSTDLIDMPSTVEGLMSVLRTVLTKPFIQSLVLEVDKPIKVTWFKDISDSILQSDPEMSPDEVLAKIPLEEFSSSTSSFKELLIDAFVYVDQKRGYVTHILVGSVSTLKDFVGLPSMMSLPEIEGTDSFVFLGAELIEVNTLPEDVVILISSDLSRASLSEAKSGLKLVL